jgi:hypothetical protein
MQNGLVVKRTIAEGSELGKRIARAAEVLADGG